MSYEVWWEIFECGYVVVLLFFDLVCDEVVLIEQIWIVVYDISEIFWLLEMVVGMIEEGESVEDVVCCEVIEEVGLIVKWTKLVLSFLVSLGGISECLLIMVGEVDVMIVSGIYGLVDENEDICVYVVSWEQVYQWVEEGKIDNVVLVIALQWLQLYY